MLPVEVNYSATTKPILTCEVANCNLGSHLYHVVEMKIFGSKDSLQEPFKHLQFLEIAFPTSRPVI